MPCRHDLRRERAARRQRPRRLRRPRPGLDACGPDEQLLPLRPDHELDRGRQARRRVRRRPLRRARRQPQRHDPRLEQRRLLLQVDGRRHDVDRPDAGEQRPVGGSDAANANGDELRQGAATAVATTEQHRREPSPGASSTTSGADQFFPWVTINTKGNLNVTFHDRRLDTDSPVGVGCVADLEDRGRELPRLVLGRAVQDHADADGHPDDDRPGAGGRDASASRPRPWSTRPSRPGSTRPRRRAGNGQNSATLPFKNFQISDIGSNFDYSFRAGLFAGDYSGNTSGPIVNGTRTRARRQGRRPRGRVLDRRPQRSRLRRSDLDSSRAGTRSASSRTSSSTTTGCPAETTGTARARA